MRYEVKGFEANGSPFRAEYNRHSAALRNFNDLLNRSGCYRRRCELRRLVPWKDVPGVYDSIVLESGR